jgi:hypothetical protein
MTMSIRVLSSLFKLARSQKRGRRRRVPYNLIGFYDIAHRHAETWKRDPRWKLLTDESEKGSDPGRRTKVIWPLRSDALDETAFG